MARLPTVGGDSGNWGSLLNEYLGTAHNADGTLKLDVKTIADLKAIDVASLTDKQQALVAGYYTAGDGGGGQFYYDQGSSSANNGGTVIAPTAGTGRWRRVYSGSEINVKWFGAKGDGTTDDTAAINAAAATFLSLYFPRGRYRITAPLDLTSNFPIQKTVRGDGWETSTGGSIIYAETGGVAIDCMATYNITIRDLSITSSGRSNPSIIGVLYARSISPSREFCNQNTIERVSIDLESVPAANNNFGSIGIYNIASEMSHYTNIQVRADTPICVANANIAGITPPRLAIGTQSSTANIGLSGAATSLRTRSGGSYPCVRLKGVAGFSMAGGFLSSTGAKMEHPIIMDSCNEIFLTTLRIENSKRVALMINDNTSIYMDLGSNESYTVAPLDVGAGTAATVDGLYFGMDDTTITGAPALISGHASSVVKNVRLHIPTDTGNVPTASFADVRGVIRVVGGASAGKGGLKDIHLVGAAVCEGCVVFDPQLAASIPNNALYRDAVTGKLAFKGADGTVNYLY